MTDTHTAQAFWLTVAQAFLPPSRPEIFPAFRDNLTDDLAELCASLDIAADAEIATLRMCLDALADHEALLVDYSHLFLQPPVPATLNLSRYVDGSLNGPCLDALENAYRIAGIEQRDTLRDLPDHISIQMESLAMILGDPDAPLPPTQFANLCLVGALPRLAAAIEAESSNSPYGSLARIAACAILDYASDAQLAVGKPNRRHDTSLGVWRHCTACGKSFAREKEIAIMTKALTLAGLPADHLDRCPDCRDATQGFFKRAIK